MQVCLEQGSCFRPGEFLRFAGPVPFGPTWEGAYADFHLIMQRCTHRELADSARLRDTEVVEDSVKSYLAHGVVLAPEKSVRFRENAVACGTEV